MPYYPQPAKGGGTWRAHHDYDELTWDNPHYVPPVWPARPGEQQMMMHLDIRVDDLEAGCAHAQACGATLADYQPQDDVRIHLDPVGHPFCLWVTTVGASAGAAVGGAYLHGCRLRIPPDVP